MQNTTPCLLLTLFILAQCAPADKPVAHTSNQPQPFINPPFRHVDVPFATFDIDAGRGDILFAETGSILLFPANAFLDKQGNIVAGNVQLKFREFIDPIDFYVSGIPMEYDSMGTKYTFESSGMCEIRAFKDGEALWVNPAQKPEVFLVSQDTSSLHHLYYLDTLQGKWLDKGRSLVTNLAAPKTSAPVKGQPAAELPEIIKPVKPGKAGGKNPVIEIEVDSASFGELKFYDHLQFEVQGDPAGFNPNDSKQEWGNVELQRLDKDGLYQLKFSQRKKVVTYPVRPVVAGKDYAVAMKIFAEKDRAYQDQLKKRLTREAAGDQGIRREDYVRDSMEHQEMLANNQRAEKLKRLIAAREKEIARRNAITETNNKRIQDYNKVNKIYRGFGIVEFGVMNCDHPILLLTPRSVSILATFVDREGNKLDLSNIAVIYKSPNVLLRNSGSNGSICNINVSAVSDNIVCGRYGDQFAYISYPDFHLLHITEKTQTKTLTMTLVPENDIDYEAIKRLSN